MRRAICETKVKPKLECQSSIAICMPYNPVFVPSRYSNTDVVTAMLVTCDLGKSYWDLVQIFIPPKIWFTKLFLLDEILALELAPGAILS